MYYVGIDFGTSGARAQVIDEEETPVQEIQYQWQQNNIHEWTKALYSLLAGIKTTYKEHLKCICVNGTSATVILCDRHGTPLDEALLYNDNRGVVVIEEIKKIAPENHTVISATSSLAKLLWWYQQTLYSQACYLVHQADWLGYLLHGKLGISDYHNALKLGYDVQALAYPQWLINTHLQPLLPQVITPGTPIGEIKFKISIYYNINKNCLVCAGTTDSIAAFLASKVESPGEAVTSLGSTLVLKLLSNIYVEDNRYGIYSHRLGNLWLTGGASNTGGAVLRHFFTNEELQKYSRGINPEIASGLDYYPLLKQGDRFPINDPNLPPRLTPRPTNQVEFLQGLLEGIARIEAQGYQLLQQLGATSLTKVYTAGGGTGNLIWQEIRQRYLGIQVVASPHTQAAYGTALLSKNGL